MNRTNPIMPRRAPDPSARSSRWNCARGYFPVFGGIVRSVFQGLEICAEVVSRGWKKCAAGAALVLAAGAAYGLGPQEIVLIVNANSAASREVANHYVKLRGVPVQNVIFLDVPAGWGGESCAISPGEFVEKIRAPVTNEIARRRIGDHVLAWVYSADFPTTVSTPVAVSLHGMTFLKGEMVEAEKVDKAKYASPFFRGPVEAGAARGTAFSMEQFAVAFPTNMPVPAMSLGHLAPRGMSAQEIVESLSVAARADFSRPDAVVNFVTGEDVRAKARAWQAPDLAAEFAELGVTALITTNVPETRRQLAGLQMGSAEIFSGLRTKLAPGSMAEHLTSFGAAFPLAEQTKITAWIKAGAAGSAGTVTEPYAVWTKFPHARFHAHYAAGCTMLEAFVQSIGCPLQIYLLGDPLCRPFARPRSLTVAAMADDIAALKGVNEFFVVEGNGIAPRDMTFIHQVDGVTSLFAGTGSRLRVDAAVLSDGWHELRVTGYGPGKIRQQVSATKHFAVNNRGRSCAVVAPDAKTIAGGAEVEVKLEATAGAARYELRAQGRVIASDSNAVLKVDFASAGPGPVWLQAAAIFPDGETVRSRPRLVEITAGAGQ